MVSPSAPPESVAVTPHEESPPPPPYSEVVTCTDRKDGSTQTRVQSRAVVGTDHS